MPRKNPRLIQLEDGTWTDGDRPLTFAVHLNQILKLGPAHIFDHNADRSVCGLARSASPNYIYQSVFPRNHSVCRQCNQSLHFGEYGGSLHSHATPV